MNSTTTTAGDGQGIDVPKGLSGVVVTETRLSDVRGREGFYHYRQYSAIELAEKRTFEDVWHLMLLGTLPSGEERHRFLERTLALRRLPDALRPVLPALATPGGGPLEAVRGAVSAAGAMLGMKPLYDLSPERRLDDALRVSALMPTLLTALHRLSLGRSSRATTCRTPPTTSTCSPARSRTPRTPGRSSSTSSPPSTTASTPPRSPRG